MSVASCWLIAVLLLTIEWLVWAWRQDHPPQARSTPLTATIQRLLRPRPPEDCPACRHQAAGPALAPPARPPIHPWHEVKSRRGAPKRINTQGFACPTHTCVYYRITDAHVHALVGDSTHGKTEPIQTFRCQACKTTFSARRHTPLYRLKTASDRVGEVLTALTEGLDVAATGCVFGHRESTITAWLTRAGEHGATLHDRCFRKALST